MSELQLQQRQPAAPGGADGPSLPDLGDDQRTVILQCVRELRHGLQGLDTEVRTRQLATARDTIRAMAIVVGILDGALPDLLGTVRLCKCGRVADRATGTCWRCG